MERVLFEFMIKIKELFEHFHISQEKIPIEVLNIEINNIVNDFQKGKQSKNMIVFEGLWHPLFVEDDVKQETNIKIQLNNPFEYLIITNSLKDNFNSYASYNKKGKITRLS